MPNVDFQPIEPSIRNDSDVWQLDLYKLRHLSYVQYNFVFRKISLFGQLWKRALLFVFIVPDISTSNDVK